MQIFHPIDQVIGKNLRKIRKQQGISGMELGQALSAPITFQQVHKYERGENRICARMLLECCMILNCQLSDMLNGVYELLKRNSAIEPYVPDKIEPYVIDDSNLSPASKEFFREACQQMNVSLAKQLTRNKDINNG